MPASWLFQNSLRNGGSVASFCVTSNCSGVSFCFSSEAGGLANVLAGTVEVSLEVEVALTSAWVPGAAGSRGTDGVADGPRHPTHIATGAAAARRSAVTYELSFRGFIGGPKNNTH